MSSAPRIVGCEAAYWFPMDVDVCGSNETPSNDGAAPTSSTEGGESSVDVSQEKFEEGGDGNLVIHVRSGDIFKSSIHESYGQVRELRVSAVQGASLFHAIFIII